MDFVWQFFYNAGWPLMILGGLGFILGLWGVIRYSRLSERSDTDQYRAQQMRGIYAALAGFICLIVGYAVPSPDYRVVYRDRIVYKQPARVELFRDCVGDAQPGSLNYDDIVNQCRMQAVEATGGIRTITTTQTRDRIVYRVSPFRELYETCLNKFYMDSSNPVKERLAVNQSCENSARQGSSQIVIANEIRYLREREAEQRALAAVKEEEKPDAGR